VAEREMLEDIGSLTETHPRVAQRIRVVLLAAAGTSNRAIAAATGMHYNRVGVWRRRYSMLGLAGLEDEERTGRPSVYGVDAALTLMSIIATAPPDGLPRWTVKLLADQMAAAGIPISVSQLWRISVGLDLLETSTSQWLLAKRQDQWVNRVEICAFGSSEDLRSVVFAVCDEPTALPWPSGGSQLLAGAGGDEEAAASTLARVDFGQAAVSLAAPGSFAGADSLVAYLRSTLTTIGDTYVLYCVVSGQGSDLDALDAAARDSSGRISIHRSSSNERWVNQARLIASAHARYVALSDGERPDSPSASLVDLFTAHRQDGVAYWWNREAASVGDRDESRELTEVRGARPSIHRRIGVNADASLHGGEHGRSQPVRTLAG
jgi:transposase